jgi:hypothetical protein
LHEAIGIMRKWNVDIAKAMALLSAGGFIVGGLVWWRLKAPTRALGEAEPEQTLAAHAQPPALSRAQQYFFDTLDEAPPSIDDLPPASNATPVTAQPMPRAPSPHSADDWDTVDPEGLGEAFLTRATETATDSNDEDENDARLLEIWKSGV